MSNLSQAKENLKIEKKRLKKARESGDKNAVKICQGNINQYKDRIKGLEKSEKNSKGKKSKGSKKAVLLAVVEIQIEALWEDALRLRSDCFGGL